MNISSHCDFDVAFVCVMLELSLREFYSFRIAKKKTVATPEVKIDQQKKQRKK